MKRYLQQVIFCTIFLMRTQYRITVIQIKFLDKREKMDNEEGNVDVIFKNSLNAFHAVLYPSVILPFKWRLY